jgi:tetratricopeptide (TPR) repeat protein
MAAFRESKVRLGPGRLLAAALIAGMLVLGARPASGQSSEPDQAREHYKKGLAAYNLGQYPEAASEFEAAYRLFLDPALLFNIAQAHRMNGDLEKALNGYRSFLRTAPSGTQNRAQAEKWRQELEREVAKAKAAATAPVSKPPATTSGTPTPTPTPTPTQIPAAENAPATPAPAALTAAGAPPTALELAASNPETPAAMPTLEATPAPARTADSSESSHWWIWGVAGGAVVAGVITALLLTRSHSTAPDCLGINPCGTLH